MSEPGAIRLQVGEDFRMPLEGLGSAGYVWQSDIDGADPGIATVQIEPGAAVPAGQPGGYSVDYTARISAVRPGSATIRLFLRRPWERGVEPIRRIDVPLEVTSGSELHPPGPRSAGTEGAS